MLNYFKGNEFDLHKNSLPFAWLCTRTRFETEACSNSEMGYWLGAVSGYKWRKRTCICTLTSCRKNLKFGDFSSLLCKVPQKLIQDKMHCARAARLSFLTLVLWRCRHFKV